MGYIMQRQFIQNKAHNKSDEWPVLLTTNKWLIQVELFFCKLVNRWQDESLIFIITGTVIGQHGQDV